MFQFRRFPSLTYGFSQRYMGFSHVGFPFGHLRIKACLQLPAAYRSLPRPSSAPIAKAFPLRPLQLDQAVTPLSRRLRELCHRLDYFVVPTSSTVKPCFTRFLLLLFIFLLIVQFSRCNFAPRNRSAAYAPYAILGALRISVQKVGILSNPSLFHLFHFLRK